jgi:hypothetical protein
MVSCPFENFGDVDARSRARACHVSRPGGSLSPPCCAHTSSRSPPRCCLSCGLSVLQVRCRPRTQHAPPLSGTHATHSALAELWPLAALTDKPQPPSLLSVVWPLCASGTRQTAHRCLLLEATPLPSLPLLLFPSSSFSCASSESPPASSHILDLRDPARPITIVLAARPFEKR